MQTPLQRALAAALEFKHLLDIQPVGTLFTPGRKYDARDSAGYRNAAALLAEFTPQEIEGSQNPGGVLLLIAPIVDVIPNHGADAPAETLDILADIRVAIAQLGIKEIDQHGGRGEDCGLLIFSFSGFSRSVQIAELVQCVRNVVHKDSKVLTESNSATEEKSGPVSGFSSIEEHP